MTVSSKTPTSSQTANAMWGGRFAAGPDAIMQAINASISFDQRLYAQDIRGSRAHAAMLAATGILTDIDAEAIGEGLLTVLSEIETGNFPFRVELEDIHMNVEARLKEIGMAGFASPVKMTCTDHSGHHKAYVAEWDGTKWTQKGDWIEPMKDEVRPLIEANAKDYTENYADTHQPGQTTARSTLS